jgi:hypothetical protein
MVVNAVVIDWSTLVFVWFDLAVFSVFGNPWPNNII